MLTKTMRLNYLLDFYQTLLTPKQQEYMSMYYFEDFSLVEIAKVTNVSRQAVYDNIKRTEAVLETYEEKLKLYEKFSQRIALLDKMSLFLMKDEKNQAHEMIKQLKQLG